MVRQKNWVVMLSASVIVIVFLTMQWLLVDFTFAFETPVFISHPAPIWFSVTASGVETNTPHVTSFSFLVVTVVQWMFAIVLPTVWSNALLKWRKLRTRGKAANKQHPFAVVYRQSNRFVATLRQLCASPDAHGP